MTPPSTLNLIALPEQGTFTDRVREVVRSVPTGTLLTYGEVAAEAGRPGAARAVGRILSEHGVDLPWWRIVPASGRLAPHLARRQADALRAEGVAVEGGRVRYGRTDGER
jgi:methylated-DNA-protein-cysteine methyltransferase related protein